MNVIIARSILLSMPKNQTEFDNTYGRGYYLNMIRSFKTKEQGSLCFVWREAYCFEVELADYH